MDQHLPSPLPDRRTAAVHVKKYRRVRASPNRTSPGRSASTPTHGWDTSTLEKANDELKSIQYSLSIDSAYFPSSTPMMANRSTHSGYSLPMSQQNCTTSSQSNSGSSQWSKPNSQSSADYSMTDMTGVNTPNLTFSDSDSTHHDPQYVATHAPSSLHSQRLSVGTNKVSSRKYGQPTLWVDTTMDGSASDLCDSPVDSDPKEDPPYSRMDDPTAQVHSTGESERLHFEIDGAVVHAATGCHQKTYPESLNDPATSNAFNVASPFSLEDNHSQHGPVSWCQCHWLLKRPSSIPLETGTILKLCRLYSRQMRNSRQTLLRRLQDRFEFLRQRISLAIPSLQSQVQEALGLLLDKPPTTKDALITLSLLSATQPPPSLQGYISLTLFAKAWLSLSEQQGMADVTYGLFLESSRSVAAMASSQLEQEAYDILLQLLWQPVTTAVSFPDRHSLFCPQPSRTEAGTVGDNYRVKTISNIGLKWVLSHVCRDIVDGKINVIYGYYD